MKFRLLLIPALAALAGGCFSVTDPEIGRWPIDFDTLAKPAATRNDGTAASAAGRGVSAAESKYGAVRIVQLAVRSPYDGEGLTVLRADGTVAFDPYNEFAAIPSHLLRGPVYDAVAASGRFAYVLDASSIADTEYSIEATVTRLCLDCRAPGARNAVCEVRLRLLHERDIVGHYSGTGVADAADGDYGKAFSRAVSAALAEALGKLD